MTRKIAIIGNAGGGKTTLAQKLGAQLSLPVTHVDSIQFLAGMKIRPHAESIQILNEIEARDAWIIDGFGPLDIIENRFQLADRILFIDLPLWRHYWWCTKRQMQNLWSKRGELPPGCDEFSIAQTRKLYRTLWKVHHQMRPELIRILSRPQFKNKTLRIQSHREWLDVLKTPMITT